MEENKMIKHTQYGWIDLSNVVLTKGGKVNWRESVGCIIPFQYKEINTYLIIDEFIDRCKISISIPNYVNNRIIHTSNVMSEKFGVILGKITPDFRYKVGDIVNDSIVILSSRKDNRHKCYKYRCLIDGHEGLVRESVLTKGYKCPVCNRGDSPMRINKRISKGVDRGINDIATIRPDIATLLWDMEDSYKYTAFSSQKAYFKCPRCGNKIYATISNVAWQGLSCRKCGDGISYPNKFVYNVIDQISMLYQIRGEKFEFTPEKRFSWSMNFEHENKKLAGKKIYDIFIDTHNIIIENQGNYHYIDACENWTSARSFEEVQENDIIKHNLAISNGIKEECYIILDCYKSNMEYIKKSIMSSNLPTLLNFTESDIDWCECDAFATSSRVYEACCHWNNGIRNRREIASIMKMAYSTIKRYIQKGRELNFIID